MLWFSVSELSTPAALLLTCVLTERKRDRGQTVCDNNPFPWLALNMGVYTRDRMSGVKKSVGGRGNVNA